MMAPVMVPVMGGSLTIGLLGLGLLQLGLKGELLGKHVSRLCGAGLVLRCLALDGLLECIKIGRINAANAHDWFLICKGSRAKKCDARAKAPRAIPTRERKLSYIRASGAFDDRTKSYSWPNCDSIAQRIVKSSTQNRYG
jgi:hypothetical protein